MPEPLSFIDPHSSSLMDIIPASGTEGQIEADNFILFLLSNCFALPLLGDKGGGSQSPPSTPATEVCEQSQENQEPPETPEETTRY